jgi:hypothetical protein
MGEVDNCFVVWLSVVADVDELMTFVDISFCGGF